MSDSGQSKTSAKAQAKTSTKTLVERLAEKQTSASPATEPAPAVRANKTGSGSEGLTAASEGHSVRTHSGKTRHIATIDLKRMRALGFVTPDGGHSQVIEEFRAIKRPLLRRAFEGGGQGRNHVIVVTSARPGEGKTFSSINLAMSIASERGLNVLLIDGDVIKSDVPEVLGFHAETGFLDLLVDRDLDLTDVLVRTNIPNLSVLPSGKHHDHATELLAGPAMADLIGDIANRYSDRVIIFNAPPVLVSSEACVLASHAGQVVMVVEADKTARRDIAHAVSLLGEDANINFVLNKVTDRRVSERYGAYSYYGRSR